MSWEQLGSGVDLPFPDDLTVPELHELELDVPSPPAVDDIEAAARAAASATFADAVRPGMTIAVGAGSRGLTGRTELLRGTIAALRDLGAEPFVVPAMGSHGGATADGGATNGGATADGGASDGGATADGGAAQGGGTSEGDTSVGPFG